MEPEREKSPPDTSCGLFSHVSTSDKPGRQVDRSLHTTASVPSYRGAAIES